MPRLFCITSDIPGSTEFSVTIENDQTVDELKEKIKMALELNGLMANALLLYKINALGNNLKERKEALEKEIRRVEEARKTNNDTGLDPLDAIQDVFQNRTPPAKTIHILVVVPSGEPIVSLDSCARGEVNMSLPMRCLSGVWVANSSPRDLSPYHPVVWFVASVHSWPLVASCHFYASTLLTCSTSICRV